FPVGTAARTDHGLCRFAGRDVESSQVNHLRSRTMDTAKRPLADMLIERRRELEEARREGERKDLRFRVESVEIEIELEVTVAKSAEAGAGCKF
ncbi:trypco2 family protein, partial [uncultured Thiodictyon sp.]|uniref:trypco2 family protein n=1 Tax=uncultured Thiodictyon sp. TaxID=1846217 RepID=UPI0025FE618B